MAYKKQNKNTNSPAQNFAELEMGKLPPQAIELEEAVLGALMLEKEALTKVIDILREESFYKDSHKKIFGAIKRLFQRSEPIDILTVTNELKRNEELESVGGAYYISQLTSRIASSANIEYHARIVLQKYIQRELISFSSETIESAYDNTLDVFELLDKAEKRLFSIADENIKKDPERAGSLINEVIKQVEAARNRKSGITGVPSGFSELDRITSGWQNSDLIILAARPSMGKTALALTLACNAAIQFQEPVALFSLEMSNLQLATRIISSETEIPMEKLRKGSVNEDDMSQLVRGVTRFSDAPIFIDDTAALSVFDLRAKARRLKENHGIKMIMIDYLQLMTATVEGRGNREQEISSISRALKSLAKELNVPIIALSQLSRAVEQRGGAKRPQLSDLRESGAIEQDADMVLFVYRQDYYGAAPEGADDLPPDSAEIIIAKHRNGPLDSVHLKFQKELAKFTEFEPSLDNYHSATSDHDIETRIVQSRNWDNKKNDIEEEGPF
jgi:replicative DNA helicase